MLNEKNGQQYRSIPVCAFYTKDMEPLYQFTEYAAIYDNARARMVIFGGYDEYDYLSRDDVWALSLSGTPAWTQLAPCSS